jgi:squalene cyclase
MRTLIAIGIWFCSLTVLADEPAGPKPNATTAIERGLGFLAQDALAWKEAHNCASCHHAGMVVWALRAAKVRGFAVDEPVLAEMTQWMAASGDGKMTIERPASAPHAMSTKALYFALGLLADPEPDAASQEGLKRLLQTIESEQIEDGSWSGWPETRPPLFGDSNDKTTALATLALLPAAASGDEPAKVARDKAAAWLAANKTDDDPQSIAMRLVLWRQLNRPVEEWGSLAQRIKDRQNADGGWSQTPEMASDAWATGQALYALAHADLKNDDPVIERGRAFLVATQRDDGSWPMTSRPMKPGGAGAKNLIPITGAGSAWAVLGLLRSG